MFPQETKMAEKPLLKKRIVFAAHTPIGAPYVVGSHHLAREMAYLGHDVTHIPFPFSIFDLFREESEVFGRLRARALFDPRRLLNGGWALDNLHQIAPFSPFPWRLSRRKMDEAYLKLNARLTWLGKARRAADLLFIDHPRQTWVTCAIPAKRMIYRPTDIYSYPGHRDHDVILAMERFLIRHAHMIVTTSEAVAERMRKLMDEMGIVRPMQVVLNGVDLDAFGSSADAPVLKRSRQKAIYVGAIDDRFDADMLEFLARNRPNVDFIIAGPLQKRETLSSLPANVKVLGAVPYTEVPALLQDADAALLLLNDHPFNTSRSPMKLYEYAASGLSVACGHTPELAKRNETFMHFYRNREEAVIALDQALAVDADARLRAREAAVGQSWRAKARHIYELVSADV